MSDETPTPTEQESNQQPVKKSYKSEKPPTFRGSDFAMRYAQGFWSEERIVESINASEKWRALPYGRSGVGPDNKDEIADYWAKYRAAESIGKRPDLLVLRREDYDRLLPTLPADTTLATDDELSEVLKVAVCGIEAENSLWIAAQMPDYGKAKITKKNFIAPTVIVKREDEAPLVAWQEHYGVPICVVQVFFDRGYIIRLSDITDAVAQIQAVARGEGVETLGIASMDVATLNKAKDAKQKEIGVFIVEQQFYDSRTNTATAKTIYKTHYTRATLFGVVPEGEDKKPQLDAKVIVEANGKIMPYVTFKGGALDLSPDVDALFEELISQ